MTAPESLPLVSVIMPVLNEERFIQRALVAVQAQDYPAEGLEILVVDGGSVDSTCALVQALMADDPRIRLLTNPERIQACALNIGIRAAQGTIIVRVDGRAILAPDYVRRCVFHLAATGADNVGGPQRMVGETAVGRAIAAAYRSPFGVPSRFTTSTQAGWVDTVYLGAWPHALFQRIGYFNETLAANEDYELNYRIRQAGGRIYLTPDIRADYYGRQSLGAFWRQFFSYGRWKAVMLHKHPASVRMRQVVAPLWVAALVSGALLAPFSRLVRRVWQGVMVSYALANAIASAREAARDDWDLLPRLPVVFASMHFAWGSGFLVEMARLVWAKSGERI